MMKAMARPRKNTFESMVKSRTVTDFVRQLGNIAGVSMTVYHSDNVHCEVVDEPARISPLCKLIWSKGWVDRCVECNKEHFAEAARKRHSIRYLCHAGLVENIIPVFSEGNHIGTLVCGMFLPSPPSEEGFQEFLGHNRHMNLDPTAARKAYFAAPYLPGQKLDDLMGLMAFFADYVCQMGRRIESLEQAGQPDEFTLAKRYIEDHFREDISLSQVADHVGLSPAYFCDRFGKVIGMNFREYLQQLRIEEARALLAQTDQQVTKIAFACGFNGLTQFNRAFRRRLKCSPTQFRRKVTRTKNKLAGRTKQ